VTLTHRQLVVFIIIDVVLVAFAVWYFGMLRRTPPPIGLEHFSKGAMRLTSPAFAQNEPIPKKYSCQGAGISPPFVIGGVPADARSLALIVEDPDAPPSVYTHWVVWNIPPDVTRIAEGALPAGAVQGTNSALKKTYVGPCPAAGTHRYFFELFALDDAPQIGDDSDAKSLLAVITPHVIAQTALEGTYRKQ
jgi:Raf kinase inhibitor-like YbhB/YbcL family protein